MWLLSVKGTKIWKYNMTWIIWLSNCRHQETLLPPEPFALGVCDTARQVTGKTFSEAARFIYVLYLKLFILLVLFHYYPLYMFAWLFCENIFRWNLAVLKHLLQLATQRKGLLTHWASIFFPCKAAVISLRPAYPQCSLEIVAQLFSM